MNDKNQTYTYICKYVKDNKYTEDILMNNQLCFSCAKELNDPYECVDLIKDITREHIQLWQKYSYMNIDDVKKLSEFENQSQHYIDNLEEYLALQQIGILSLTTNFNNPIMWAHYGDNHNGLCFKFRVENDPYAFQLNKVRYVKERTLNDKNIRELLQECQGDLTEVEKRARAAVLSKYRGWSYEKEYRVLEFNGVIKNGRRFRKFKKNALNSIYFGYKMADEDIRRYVKLCKTFGYGHVKFYKMFMSLDGSLLMQPYQLDVKFDQQKLDVISIKEKWIVNGKTIFDVCKDEELLKKVTGYDNPYEYQSKIEGYDKLATLELIGKYAVLIDDKSLVVAVKKAKDSYLHRCEKKKKSISSLIID